MIKNFKIVKGKVSLLNNINYPEHLLKLSTKNTAESRHFRQHIRLYNNALAFANLRAKFDALFDKGPQVIRICRQIYHIFYSLHPNENEAKRVGQLYILDNETATHSRLYDNIASLLNIL